VTGINRIIDAKGATAGTTLERRITMLGTGELERVNGTGQWLGPVWRFEEVDTKVDCGMVF
jgi:hypothetical protein